MKFSPCAFFTLALVASSFLFCAASHSAEKRERFYRGVDLQCELHILGQDAGTKAVVVCFLAPNCHISDGYVTALKSLSTSYRRRGIDFFAVLSEPTLTRCDAVAQCDERKLPFPVLFDVSDELFRELGPTHKPQVFLLNRNGEKLYSGAIDDGRPTPNSNGNTRCKRESVKRRFLGDAIRAVLKGEKIRRPRTKSDGRLLTKLAAVARRSEVNYARHIAPIILTNCAPCHRPGQSAPFSLLTYYDVRKHARQIVEVTQSRFMPPWKPEPGFGHFLDERRLTQHELSLVKT